MTEKVKRKELIRLYGDLDKEFNEYIDEAEDRMLAVTRGHAQGLQDATAATARLKNELVQANRSWAASQERVRVVEKDNAALDAKLDATEGELVEANLELTKLRGQLRRIREHWEPLYNAIFPREIHKPTGGILDGVISVPAQPFPWGPNIIGPVPLTGVSWNTPTDQQYVGANYDPFLEAAQTLVTKPNGPTWQELMEQEDKVDRLNEAGYSCATEKAKLEDAKVQAEAYAGLS